MADTFGSAASPANFVNAAIQVNGNQIFPVIQIVSSTNATASSTTSTAFADTNLSVTITPKFNTSKILLQASGTLGTNTGTAMATLANGTTNLLSAQGGAMVFSTGAAAANAGISLLFYDSPATTSAVTYKVRIRSLNNTETTTFSVSNSTAVLIATEIAQ